MPTETPNSLTSVIQVVGVTSPERGAPDSLTEVIWVVGVTVWKKRATYRQVGRPDTERDREIDGSKDLSPRERDTGRSKDLTPKTKEISIGRKT